jgi:aspartate aminotransferase-like enzyme
MNRANFSTGPVGLSERVQRALSRAPVSHRSRAFVDMLAETKRHLRELVHANNVAVACGSGTLANEMIAQQLRALKTRGLILINGEFGARLANAATRAGLDFDTLDAAWGDPIELSVVERKLDAGDYGWLWCVATETSTGSRFDIDALQALAAKRSVRLCVDCMSAIGVAPLNLEHVYLASASSGKGLASVAGLAIVFAQSVPTSRGDVPATLDLALHLHDDAVPFTLPSSLLAPLHASLQKRSTLRTARYVEIAEDSALLRREFARNQLTALVDGTHAASGIVTIALPSSVDSSQVGQHLRDAGIEIGFESEYLRRRNWIQVALMGHYPRAMLKQIPALIREIAEQASGLPTKRRATDVATPVDHRADARFA